MYLKSEHTRNQKQTPNIIYDISQKYLGETVKSKTMHKNVWEKDKTKNFCIDLDSVYNVLHTLTEWREQEY